MSEIGSGINNAHVPAAVSTIQPSVPQDSGEGGHRLV